MPNMRGTIFTRIEMAKGIVRDDPSLPANRKRLLSVLDEAFFVLMEAEQMARTVEMANTAPLKAQSFLRRCRLTTY